MPVFRLHNPIQKYEWGSHDYIQELIGVSDDIGIPYAELWIGAHPKASSVLTALDSSLYELITGQGTLWLGSRCRNCGYDQLPFLLKILASAKPLSIQIHPDLISAQEGFVRENALGIAVDHPRRNYRDANHKPELLLALTEFYALCGFREYHEIASWLAVIFENLSIPPMQNFIREPSAANLRSILVYILSAADRKQTLIDTYLSRISQVSERDPNGSQILDWSLRIADSFPADIGVMSPILLNLIKLDPDQAIYLSPGVIHSYLEGAGAEIMANSDNVLRCALTPKHVDIDELTRVASFTPYRPRVIHPERLNRWESVYHAPVNEFRLSMIDLSCDQYLLPVNDLPHILMCLDGGIDIADTDSVTSLNRGEAAYLTPTTTNLRLEGKGRALHATLPLKPNSTTTD